MDEATTKEYEAVRDAALQLHIALRELLLNDIFFSLEPHDIFEINQRLADEPLTISEALERGEFKPYMWDPVTALLEDRLMRKGLLTEKAGCMADYEELKARALALPEEARDLLLRDLNSAWNHTMRRRGHGNA